MQCTRCGLETPEPSCYGTSLMRHGRTNLNEQSRTIGSLNDPLNNVGRRQSYEAAARFKTLGRQWNIVISSTFLRAFETAMIVANALKIPVTTDVMLRERCVGELEGKPETQESDARLLDYDFLPKGAEPLNVFENRVAEVLEQKRRINALFVTHSFWFLTAVKIIYGWDVARIKAYEPPGNCCEITFYTGKPCNQCGNCFFVP